jgi:hypothetical protein
MYIYAMPQKVRYNFWITEEQRDRLRGLKEETGVPESEQIRRAITDWLVKHGVKTKTVKRRRP